MSCGGVDTFVLIIKKLNEAWVLLRLVHTWKCRYMLSNGQLRGGNKTRLVLGDSKASSLMTKTFSSCKMMGGP
jgi:hypothetical protein